MRERFKTFIVISLVILFGLIGLGITQLETEHTELRHTTTRLERLVKTESEDRETAILKNVEARKADCEANNEVRAALVVNVTQGEKQLPLILKLVPSLNDKRVLAANQKSINRQLKAFKKINCEAYSLRAVPTYETQHLSLQQQQNALAQTQKELHNQIRQQAEARVITVRQRCQLTDEIVGVLNHYSHGKVIAPFIKSATECHRQLVKVEHLAHATQ